MNFEQLIIQDGFIAVNFDLWLLLVKYKIPSIFISSRDIPETRFNLKEFVCYTSENTDKYAFILTPAMRKRKLNELPTYGLIVNKNKIDIQLSDIPRSEGLTNIENAIDQYISIEDYMDVVFEKDATTKYQRKMPGIRQAVEFEEIEEPVLQDVPVLQEEQQEQIIVPAKKSRSKKIKASKIAPTLILEEDDAAEEIIYPAKKEMNISDILLPTPEMEIVPIKKRKTKKQRENKLKVNPHGKRSRKKLPENIEIVEEL